MDALEKMTTEEICRREIEAANEVKKLFKGETVEKLKMVAILDQEGADGGMVFDVADPSFGRIFQEQLLSYGNRDGDDMPSVVVEMFTQDQWDEACKLGAEL